MRIFTTFSPIAGPAWIVQRRPSMATIITATALDRYRASLKRVEILDAALAEFSAEGDEALGCRAALLEAHGVEASLVGSRPVKWWDGFDQQEQVEPLSLMVLGETWVVAEGFDATRVQFK